MTAATTAWDRLVDWLTPDPVMFNTFPQTNVTTDLMELTGNGGPGFGCRDTGRCPAGGSTAPTGPDAQPGP